MFARALGGEPAFAGGFYLAKNKGEYGAMCAAA